MHLPARGDGAQSGASSGRALAAKGGSAASKTERAQQAQRLRQVRGWLWFHISCRTCGKRRFPHAGPTVLLQGMQ